MLHPQVGAGLHHLHRESVSGSELDCSLSLDVLGLCPPPFQNEGCEAAEIR